MFGFVKKGGIQFYTVENLARNVPDRGHSASNPPPRSRGKKRGVDQSKAAKRAEVPRQTTALTNERSVWVGRCVVFTNDNNNKKKMEVGCTVG